MNVAPQEAQAILDLMGGKTEGREVTERDFGSPRRLSPRDLAALTLKLEKAVEKIQAHLSGVVGTALPVSLRAVRECTADGLFDDEVDLVVGLAGRVRAQVAWLLWSNPAAIACLETMLGAGPQKTAPEPRRLGRIEVRMLERLLIPAAELIAAAVQLSFEGGQLVQAREELGTWLDVQGTPDAHRVEVELALRGPGGESTLVVYLPGLEAPAPPAPKLPDKLPSHLDLVEVDVHVRLQGCDVSLDQLLALEPGDVVPIEARLGDPASISIEDREFGIGRLGAHRGQLAIRIEGLYEEPQEDQ